MMHAEGFVLPAGELGSYMLEVSQSTHQHRSLDDSRRHTLGAYRTCSGRPQSKDEAARGPSTRAADTRQCEPQESLYPGLQKARPSSPEI